MYVYTPPQGHHTPPHPMGGGVGTRDTGPYICTIYTYVHICTVHILTLQTDKHMYIQIYIDAD